MILVHYTLKSIKYWIRQLCVTVPLGFIILAPEEKFRRPLRAFQSRTRILVVGFIREFLTTPTRHQKLRLWSLVWKHFHWKTSSGLEFSSQGSPEEKVLVVRGTVAHSTVVRVFALHPAAPGSILGFLLLMLLRFTEGISLLTQWKLKRLNSRSKPI